MIISYWLFNNKKIELTNSWNELNRDTLSNLSKQYIDLTDEFPTKLYLGSNLYGTTTNILGVNYCWGVSEAKSERQFVNVNTDFGVVQIVPVSAPNHNFILLGQEKDYNRYIMGDIFHKEILNG